MSIHTIYVGNTPNNSVSVAGLITLQDQVQTAIDQQQAMCFVAKHPGRFFCAGFDVAELKPLPSAQVQQHFEQFLQFMRLVFSAPVPVFCQAQGHAVGIGAALCLAADLTGLDQQAKFRFPEVTLGLSLFADVVSLLHYRLAAPKQAESVLMQAQALTAPQAQQMGLIDTVLDASSPTLAMTEYCEQFFISGYGPMKQLCRSGVLQGAISISDQVGLFMASWKLL